MARGPGVLRCRCCGSRNLELRIRMRAAPDLPPEDRLAQAGTRLRCRSCGTSRGHLRVRHEPALRVRDEPALWQRRRPLSTWMFGAF